MHCKKVKKDYTIMIDKMIKIPVSKVYQITKMILRLFCVLKLSLLDPRF